jgi:deoxycytidylate deaminase
MNFVTVKLSDVVRTEWSSRTPDRKPTRAELQSLGDDMRRTAGPAVLATRSLEGVQVGDNSKIVIDGIRNYGEVAFLRSQFDSAFFLFAMECNASERWGRVTHEYRSIDEFAMDDSRDRDEDYPFGQQVQRCVDDADVLIDNSDKAGLAALRDRLPDYINLITGAKPRYATPNEIFMNLAYSAAHGSKCRKRQVGAVVVSAPPGQMGDIVGQGFNENPARTKACVEEPKYGGGSANGKSGRCYRDIIRDESLEAYIKHGVRCPLCGAALTRPTEGRPVWTCGSCKQDIERFLWPERAMTLCTAIHAEVAALFAAGRRSQNATLYTTTMPCFQCTEKIILAGIKCIVFNEPYPDARAGHRLELAEIEMLRFEGVRSRRFDEIFSRARH